VTTEPVYATFAKASKGLLIQLEEELREDFGPGVISKTTFDENKSDTLVFRLPTGPFAFRVHKPVRERGEAKGLKVLMPLIARWTALEALFLPGVSLAECGQLLVANDAGRLPLGEALFGWSIRGEMKDSWPLDTVGSSSRVVESTAEVARFWKAFMEGDPSVAAAHFVGKNAKALGLPAAPKFPRSSSPSSRIGPLELVATGLLLLAGKRQAAATTLAEYEARPDNQNLAAKTNELHFGRTGPERAALVDALRQGLG
jgi:hypothetical protein